MKLVNFRRLKIGRRSRLRERKRNHHLTSIKDKILPLEKTWTGNKSVAVDTGRNGATERDSGDRETVPGDQGEAVVPDDVTVHEKIRPETQWLVRTECKK